MQRAREDQPYVIDTPRGLFTGGGTWFRVREASLREYAGEVLEQVELETVVQEAEAWLRLPAAAFLVGTLAALPFVPFWGAPLLGLGVALVIRILLPAISWPSLSFLARTLQNVGVQAGLTFVVTSVLAVADELVAAGVGLTAFILVRWGLVHRLLEMSIAPLSRRLYGLPLPDEVLRSLLHRHAIRTGASLPDLDRLRKDVRQFLSSRR